MTYVVCMVVLVALVIFGSNYRVSSRKAVRQPVIIDTDVGSYMDDTAAIVYAISLQTLDVKLIVTCTNDTNIRARVAAKMLTYLGRDDIPIGVGIKTDNVTKTTFFNWSADFNTAEYKGGIFSDGIAKMADVIRSSEVPVTIVCIGPMTNFPALISRYPDVVNKSRIVAMAGSIARGYDNSTGAVAELNIALCPSCANLTFLQSWNITMAPLDSSGVVRLPAELMKQLFACLRDPAILISQMVGYYCVVVPFGPKENDCSWNMPFGSPTLFDTVAVLSTQSSSKDYLHFEDLPLVIEPDGCSIEDKVNGKMVSVALKWLPPDNKGLQSFMQSLVSVVCAHNK